MMKIPGWKADCVKTVERYQNPLYGCNIKAIILICFAVSAFLSSFNNSFKNDPVCSAGVYRLSRWLNVLAFTTVLWFVESLKLPPLTR
jgi:hypothetical protein